MFIQDLLFVMKRKEVVQWCLRHIRKVYFENILFLVIFSHFDKEYFKLNKRKSNIHLRWFQCTLLDFCFIFCLCLKETKVLFGLTQFCIVDDDLIQLNFIYLHSCLLALKIMYDFCEIFETKWMQRQRSLLNWLESNGNFILR